MPGQVPDTVRACLEELTRRLERELGDNLLEVRLFGSYARGEARPGSDVDVLVLVKNAPLRVRNTVSDVAADVGLDHDLVIGTLTWDTERLREHERLDTLLLRNIRSEGAILWSHL